MKNQILRGLTGPVILLVTTLGTTGSGAFAQETILNFEPPGPAVASAPAIPDGQPTRLVAKASLRADFESSAQWCRATPVQLNHEDYTVLELPGGGHSGEFGEPQLPGYGQFIKVPDGARVRLVVDQVEWVALPGRYNLAPRQPPPSDKAGAPPPPFTLNEAAYEPDEFLPAQPVRLDDRMRIRRQDLVHVVYTPLVYNPAEGRLQAARRVVWHLEFDLAEKSAAPFRPDATGQREFAPILQLAFDARPEATEKLAAGADLASNNGADYLIITHDNFYSNILPLANWKHAKGYLTRVVKLSEISSTPTSTNITAYIQNAYNTWSPAPTYVLLVGDSAYLPAWYKTLHSYYGTYAATDLYYSTVDGTDYFPDLFLGRLPCSTPGQCDLMVQKILGVEKTPNVTSPAMYQTALTAGEFTDSGSGYEERIFIETAEAVRDFFVSGGYAVPTAYCADTTTTPRHYNSSSYGSLLHTNGALYGGTQTYVTTSAGSAAITSAINNGVCLVQHRDHGSQTGGWATPPFSPGYASALINSNKLPVVMSINCETAWFDGASDSLAEAFVKNPNGGSHCVIGATRVSYSWHNDWFTLGLYECLYTNFFETLSAIPYYKPNLSYGNNQAGHGTHIGQMLNFGKLLMYEKEGVSDVTHIEFDILALLGDPEQSPRTAVPQLLGAAHPARLLADVAAGFDVTVTSGGSPVAGALVALVLDPGDYHTATTDGSGLAHFSFTPQIPQSNNVMSVTVSHQNGIPYEGVIVIDTSRVTVTVPASAREGDGVLASQGLIAVSPAPTNDVTVVLGSSDTSEATVPASVLVPAGQTNATFNVTIIDDGMLDGSQPVIITGNATGYASTTNVITVHDNETAALTLSLASSITEGNGSVSGTLTISAAPATGVAVELASSDTSEALVPAVAILPAGQTTTNFTVTIVDDNWIDGPQPVTITAHVAYWTNGNAALLVLDNEPTNLTVTLPAQAKEGDGTLTNAGQVTVAGPVATNVTISLVSSDTTELVVPASVTLSASNTTAYFNLTVQNDPDVDGVQSVSVTAQAPGFSNGTNSMLIYDDESPPAPSSPSPANLATNVIQTTGLSWQSGAAAGEIITNDVYFGTSPTPGAGQLLGSTTNTNWTLPLLAPQTTYYWQIIARKTGTTAGPVWQFTTRGLDHFMWNAISSPQAAGQPFSATITAQDAYNTTVSNFTGAANLRVLGGAGEILRVDFENGLQGFTLNNSYGSGNGLWHLSTGRGSDAGHSPGHSLYYGQNEGANGGGNYNVTSLANGGVVTSPAISLPAGAGALTLSYNYLMYVESGTAWDQAYVEVSTNGGASYVAVATKGVSGLTYYTGGLWVSNSVSLSPFAGTTILLRLRFDTIDSIANTTEGWFIDDIVIRSGTGLGTISLSPTNTGSFTQGVWNGNLAVPQRATNISVYADDGNGHTGISTVFDVVNTNQPPSFLAQPTNQTVMTGGTANFTVAVDGTPPLSYQWNCAGTNLSGATNAILTLTNVQLNQAGSYAVLVTNLFGSVLSSNAVLTVTVPPPCTPAPANLVAWWPAEGNANDIAGMNNGTLVGGASYAAGEAGQAFSFDGSSGYVSIPDSPLMDSFTNYLTIELWMKAGQLTANSDWKGIVTKGNTSWRLQATAGAKTLTFSASPNADLYGSRNVNDGQWHHVAAVYDGTNMFLYVDGTLDVSQPATSSVSQNSYPASIGANAQGPFGYPTYFFNGLIDETSIYNRALSSNEIAAIYNAGSSGKCAPTITPIIYQQPTDQTVMAGDTATFSVAAYGSLPLSYQWSFNGTNLNGATDATLTLTNVQSSQAGNYSVLVTNGFGSALSSNATLNVATAPDITAQPAGLSVPVGATATFSLTAGGTEPLSYFWRRNGTLIPGANGTSYSLTNAQLSDSGGKFSCLVTNAYGIALSSNAVLKVIETVVSNDLCSGAILIPAASYTALYTNTQSTAQATSTGDPVPDCVTDFGNGVWYQFTPPNSGLLTVDTFGSDFDTGLALYTGICGSLSEVACNDDTDGVTSQITIPVTGGTTYYILAGGYSGYVGNLELHLAYATPPMILVQPAGQAVIVSNNATFTVLAGGSQPLSYQWYFNGLPLTDNTRITGSATGSLSISNVLTSDAGSYTVIVTNLLGSATSTEAVLTVLVPPTITLKPVDRSVVLGQPASFSSAATGSSPLSYQWQRNGTDVPGATNTTYAISAAGTNDFGVYHLVVSNAAGVAVSADALLTWGQIAAWGRTDYGQTVVPPGLSNVVMVAGGGAFGGPGLTLALRADGTVVAWGYNSVGQTNVPASVTNVVAVAAGGMHSLVLRADGTVVSWGFVPIVPSNLSNVVAIAAGGQHNLALRSDGKVVAWGNNTYGQLNVPTNLIKVVAIGAGANHSLAVCSDGTVVAWGQGIYGQTNVPLNATNVIAVAGGLQSSLALRANGTVLSWGTNSLMPISVTNVTAGLTNVTGIGAGDSYYVALRANGTVLAWGYNNYGQTNMPAYVSNAVAVAGGGSHVLALINNGRPQIIRSPVGGTTWTGRDFTLSAAVAGTAPLGCRWQLNGVDIPGATNTTLNLINLDLTNAGNYQLIVSNALGVAASLPVPLTILSNNTLSFWSQPAGQTNYQGNRIVTSASVLGNGPLRYQWYFSVTNTGYAPVAGVTNDTLTLDPALAVQSGNYYLAVSNQVGGITSAPVNIKVQFARAWGFQAVSNPPVNVTNAIAIAAGGYANYYGHYFALGADGKLTSWANYSVYYGETNVSALSNSFVTAIAAGNQTSLALRSDGTVYAWGYGYYGQTNVPSGLNNVVAIACADYHDLALKSDGTIIAWGQNNYGEATNSLAATNAAVAIAAGMVHNLGLRTDGTVFGWGNNNYGQTTIPTAATNVIAIAAGLYHSLALRANGTVIGWGNNDNGQVAIPAGASNIVAISASGTHSTLLRNDGTVVALGFEYTGYASNMVPADLANVIAIASGGDHDFGLLGTRAPAFTIQPFSRTLFKGTTNVLLAGKVSGVQPVTYQWRFNGATIAGATNDTLLRTNLQFAQAGTYQLVASNAYGVTLSKPAKLVVTIPLGEAMDATNRLWTTSGNSLWFGQTNVTHDGLDAARSGDIGNSQETILQTILATNGPGRCIFWWKVSSEDYFDVLEFRVNGITQAAISGEVDWQSNSIPLPTGTNTLQWRYSKDASYGSGLDAAWVDQFSFVVDPPVITVQPVGRTANMGNTVQFTVTATGATPLTYLWRQNSNTTVGVSSTLTLGSVGRSRNGSYAVTVSNPGGSTLSSNAMLKVLVPQKLGVPILLPDGTLQLSSGDADGGLLSASDLANFDAWGSTNLTDWAILPGALSLTNGTLWLQDGATTNWPHRFYRITEKP